MIKTQELNMARDGQIGLDMVRYGVNGVFYILNAIYEHK